MKLSSYQGNVELFSDWRRKSPEYRVLVFPQELLVILWKKIFQRQIGREDTHNNLYLHELNAHFKKIGLERSHALLDELEEKNRELMNDYHSKLLNFIQIIKGNLLGGEIPVFCIAIQDDDTIQTIKDKIEQKRESIMDFIRREGIQFILSRAGNNRLIRDTISTQIGDMAYIAVEYIINDDDFLHTLLHSKKGEPPTINRRVELLIQNLVGK